MSTLTQKTIDAWQNLIDSDGGGYYEQILTDNNCETIAELIENHGLDKFKEEFNLAHSLGEDSYNEEISRIARKEGGAALINFENMKIEFDKTLAQFLDSLKEDFPNDEVPQI